ncbi:uncharacterized protein PRCAT00002270001 [Priceomyces carsonii]|uniref:uncharacterized protein n=1 Tax=Priceomyces carsonii TaxID=28549 RepID=UPI002ED98B9E|nr:unnamed protein product [Priceomyces carsonii]
MKLFNNVESFKRFLQGHEECSKFPLFSLPTEIIIRIFNEVPFNIVNRLFLSYRRLPDGSISSDNKELDYIATRSYFSRNFGFSNCKIKIKDPHIDENSIILQEFDSVLLFNDMLTIRKHLGYCCSPSKIIVYLKIVSLRDHHIMTEFLKLIHKHFRFDDIEFHFHVTRANSGGDHFVHYFKFPKNVRSLRLLRWGKFDSKVFASPCIELLELVDCKSIRILSSFPKNLKKFICTSSLNHKTHVIIDPSSFPETLEEIQIGQKIVLSNCGRPMPRLKSITINNAYSKTKQFFNIQILESIEDLKISKIPLSVELISRLTNLRSFMLLGYKIPSSLLCLPKSLTAMYFCRCENINLKLISFPPGLKHLMIPPTKKKTFLRSSIPYTLEHLYFDSNCSRNPIALAANEIGILSICKKNEKTAKKYLYLLKKKTNMEASID